MRAVEDPRWCWDARTCDKIRDCRLDYIPLTKKQLALDRQGSGVFVDVGVNFPPQRRRLVAWMLAGT